MTVIALFDEQSAFPILFADGLISTSHDETLNTADFPSVIKTNSEGHPATSYGIYDREFFRKIVVLHPKIAVAVSGSSLVAELLIRDFSRLASKNTNDVPKILREIDKELQQNNAADFIVVAFIGNDLVIQSACPKTSLRGDLKTVRGFGSGYEHMKSRLENQGPSFQSPKTPKSHFELQLAKTLSLEAMFFLLEVYSPHQLDFQFGGVFDTVLVDRVGLQFRRFSNVNYFPWVVDVHNTPPWYKRHYLKCFYNKRYDASGSLILRKCSYKKETQMGARLDITKFSSPHFVKDHATIEQYKENDVWINAYCLFNQFQKITTFDHTFRFYLDVRGTTERKWLTANLKSPPYKIRMRKQRGFDYLPMSTTDKSDHEAVMNSFN